VTKLRQAQYLNEPVDEDLTHLGVDVGLLGHVGGRGGADRLQKNRKSH
jgi:hypothetical protein